MIESQTGVMSDTTDWLSLARSAHDASKSYYDSSIRTQIDADLRQFYGKHPAGSKYLSEAYAGKSKLFRPKTRMAIRKNEAVAAEALFSTADVVSTSAEDEDNPEQAASAAINQELLNYRLTKSVPWFLTCIGAYQDAQTTGVCISYQYWDYNAKKHIDKPCIDLVPVENFRFDGAADWRDPINTSPYLIHLLPMYVKDVKARMRPDAANNTGESKWKHSDDAVILQAVKSYGDSTRLIREDQRQDSQASSDKLSDYQIVWVHRNIISHDDEDFVYYTLATEHLLTDPKPIKQVWWHGRRPYTMGFSVIETHKTYPSGVARLTAPLQAEANEVANTRMDNVKLAMNKRWLAKRGKQVDLRSLTRNVANSVTMVNDHDDVQALEFNDVTQSSYEEQDRLNLDMDDMAGSFSQSSIQSNRKLNETVGGMNLLSANTNQVSGYQLRVWIESWVEPTLRQMVLLEQYYESDQVVLALARDKAQLFERFGVSEITDELLMHELTINVNVGMSATNPEQQIGKLMFGLTKLGEVAASGVVEKYGGDFREIAKEVFGKLGYRDGKRFFPFKSDPMVEQLQKQIQQLTSALDAKSPPELITAQVDKLKAETQAIMSGDGDSGADMDIEAEVEAQIADVQKKADAAARAAEDKISILRKQMVDKQLAIDRDSELRRYEVDQRGIAEREKTKTAALTALKVAKINAAAKPKAAITK